MNQPVFNVQNMHELPPDCFSQEEIEQFQLVENQRLEAVSHYFWLKTEVESEPPSHLFFIELVFENHGSLLLTSGEDSMQISLASPAELIEIASNLQRLNGRVSVSKMEAGGQRPWAEFISQSLVAVRLSRADSGFYRNDAAMLEFGEKSVVICLAEGDGLAVFLKNFEF